MLHLALYVFAVSRGRIHKLLLVAVVLVTVEVIVANEQRRRLREATLKET